MLYITTSDSGGAGIVQSAGSDNSMMQSLAQLVKTQTDMVAAQTRSMSAQALPPMPHFSGDGFKLVMMTLNAGWNSSRNRLN